MPKIILTESTVRPSKGNYPPTTETVTVEAEFAQGQLEPTYAALKNAMFSAKVNFNKGLSKQAESNSNANVPF